MVASFAKTYKEAQTYLRTLIFIVIILQSPRCCLVST